MRNLRKLRIAICVFCENCEFLFCDFFFEWISWNSDKMSIGKTRPTLVLVQGVFFWFIFTQISNLNLKNSGNLESSFDWSIFQRKNLQYNNFRNFRNCDLLENQIVFYCDCDRHSKSWIVLFVKLCFFAIAIFAIHFTTLIYSPFHETCDPVQNSK